MPLSKRALTLSLGCVVALLLSRCATLAPCPNSLLPIVEIQVNNTASNHDDYGTTSSNLAARARITNPTGWNNAVNFPTDVTVELRNPPGLSNLAFSTTSGGAGSPTIFRSLPGNGGWSNFWVKGTGTSSVDKSAIIEMATSGTCDETVLARKAMMIPSGAPPIPAATANQFEIEINGSSATLDDYVTWSPRPSRIRWTTGAPNATLNVTLSNMSGANRLRFAADNLTAGNTATLSTLPLTLNGSGAWVNFFVAGFFDGSGLPATACCASVRDKDAVMEVRGPGNTLLSREGMMVRIRKNANKLSTTERDLYLGALKKVNMTFALNAANADYISFVKTHSRDSTGDIGAQVAHRQAHSGSAFLPWHRAFVLHLERLLQSADPAVALPYWKFDDNAPNIFTTAFMGSNDPGPQFIAQVSPANPIFSWSLAGEGVGNGIQRETPYGNGGHPTVPTETATLGLGSPQFLYAGFKPMEENAHNPAHSTSGANSWIGGSPAIATRDPLFFFLHCNVDRLWAKWQWLRIRNDVTNVNTYDLLGSHATPGPGIPLPSVNANRTLGQYADDTMWPWDNVLNGAGTAARPNIAILKPFPIVLGGILPLAQPTVKGVIDYAGVTFTSPGSSLGFGYDDFNPFQ